MRHSLQKPKALSLIMHTSALLAAISNGYQARMQSLQSLPLSAGQRAKLKAAGFEKPDDLNVTVAELASGDPLLLLLWNKSETPSFINDSYHVYQWCMS